MRRSGPPQRRTPLGRGSGALKRSAELARSVPPARPKKRAKSALEQALMESWALAARSKPCAKCRRRAPVVIRGHHIVKRQTVERLAKSLARDAGGDIGTFVARLAWDQRNLLPLCDRCHEAHHGPDRLSLSLIAREAPLVFGFARELGGEAEAVLRREYST